jgi:very-short-patch-repair endonuclease
MYLILKTIEALPRGRTTEELLVLVGAGFSHDKRVAAIAELSELMRSNRIAKGTDGRWRSERPKLPYSSKGLAIRHISDAEVAQDALVGAVGLFSQEAAKAEPLYTDKESTDAINPQSLLRYWRSALRADPRGATTQVVDKHGIEWALISGRGPIVPLEGESLRVTVALEALDPRFTEAVVRREGNENALALGWPMCVGRRGGVPTLQPVGLLAASWARDGSNLVISVNADDVLINPDWLRSAARLSGWQRDRLSDLFDVENSLGLRASDFVAKLKDAVASQIKGRIVGQDLVSQLDPNRQGIFDSAAIFLPTDSSFTSGAARDLDAIAAWPVERLARTALAPVFGLEQHVQSSVIQPVNAGELNDEQSKAVAHACEAPLSVVTGPPGTGKSQAIVSMAASVLLSGGSVIVASKNHQALDAVENRISELAPNIPFVTRTLKPEEDVDVGFSDALKMLVNREQATRAADVDDAMVLHLIEVASAREAVISALRKRADLECEIGDLLESVEFRERPGQENVRPTEVEIAQISWLRRVLAVLVGLLSRSATKIRVGPTGQVATLDDLKLRLKELRDERNSIMSDGDPILLGETVQELAKKVLPSVMSQRTHVTEIERQAIAEAYDDWTFSGGRGPVPTDLAKSVIKHRPLWLASILGTPRRIPLDDGLFDLVIFDEASQCDIATAIPLFARAKRAVVVGDDQQLSFIPQLGQAQDRNLMQAQGLPVARLGRFAQSRRSLFDFASRVPRVARVTLCNQYRSAGPIVDYISENFYGGQLVTSYDPAELVVPLGAKPGIAWENVVAPAVPQNGNVNPAEVSAIVRHLRALLMEQNYQGSIGIISPFRAQVLTLDEAVRAAIPETMRNAVDLKVATVDGFQGQERDLILFSPCVGPRSPQSGLTFFQRDSRRLNVAISRARAVAMIFGDLAFARSGSSKALQRLAAKATEPKARVGEGVFDSDWERRVFHALRKRGLKPFPQHEIAGRRLDFALFGENGMKLDLEVDGRRWHQTADGRRKTSDLWRDQQLKSMGWRVRRFWVDELSNDMEGCIDIIERELS